MSAEQREKLIANLSGKSKDQQGRRPSVEFQYSRYAGAAAIANQLIEAFKSAGWTVVRADASQQGGPGHPQVYVRYHPQWGSRPAAATIVLEALKSADLDPLEQVGPTGGNCDVCIVVVGS
jgi:hypothetical protein